MVYVVRSGTLLVVCYSPVCTPAMRLCSCGMLLHATCRRCSIRVCSRTIALLESGIGCLKLLGIAACTMHICLSAPCQYSGSVGASAITSSSGAAVNMCMEKCIEHHQALEVVCAVTAVFLVHVHDPVLATSLCYWRHKQAHTYSASSGSCTWLLVPGCAAAAWQAVQSHKLVICSWADMATTAWPSSDTASCFQFHAPPALSMTKPLGSRVKLLLAVSGCCACFDDAAGKQTACSADVALKRL